MDAHRATGRQTRQAFRRRERSYVSAVRPAEEHVAAKWHRRRHLRKREPESGITSYDARPLAEPEGIACRLAQVNAARSCLHLRVRDYHEVICKDGNAR